MEDGKRRGGVSPLLLIFTTILIDLIGFGMVVPLLPFYAYRLAGSHNPQTVNLLIGVIFGSYSLAQFFAAPLIGRLSDRFGRRPVLLVSVFCTGLAFLLLGFASSLWMLLIARIFDGITGGNVSTAQAYIADVTTQENRAKGMGLIGAAFGMGFILGPGMGGFLSKYSIHLPFFVASGMAFLNTISIFFFLPESLKEKKHTSLNPADHFRAIGHALKAHELVFPVLVLFIATLSFGIFQTVFPLFARGEYHYNERQVAYLYVYSGLIGVVIQGGLLGRLVKVFEEKILLIGGLSALVASYILLPSMPLLAPVLMVMGTMSVGTGLASSLLPTVISKAAPPSEQGQVMGITQSAGSLGRAIGPFLGGLMLAYLGKGSPYYACAALIAAGLVITLRRVR